MLLLIRNLFPSLASITQGITTLESQACCTSSPKDNVSYGYGDAITRLIRIYISSVSERPPATVGIDFMAKTIEVRGPIRIEANYQAPLVD